MEIRVDKDFGEVKYWFVNRRMHLSVYSEGDVNSNDNEYSTFHISTWPRDDEGVYEIYFDSNMVKCAPLFLPGSGSDDVRIKHIGIRPL